MTIWFGLLWLLSGSLTMGLIKSQHPVRGPHQIAIILFGPIGFFILIGNIIGHYINHLRSEKKGDDNGQESTR